MWAYLTCWSVCFVGFQTTHSRPPSFPQSVSRKCENFQSVNFWAEILCSCCWRDLDEGLEVFDKLVRLGEPRLCHRHIAMVSVETNQIELHEQRMRMIHRSDDDDALWLCGIEIKWSLQSINNAMICDRTRDNFWSFFLCFLSRHRFQNKNRRLKRKEDQTSDMGCEYPPKYASSGFVDQTFAF